MRLNVHTDDLLWRFLWRPLIASARPFGELSVELLLHRNLEKPLEVISAGLNLTISEAVESDLDWITRLYTRDPYLSYLSDAECDTPGAGTSATRGASAADTIDPAAFNAYLERMRRGEKCFVAFVDSEIAHVNWLLFHWGEEALTGHSITLRPGEVFTTDALTLQKFRGNNIHAAVLREMLRHAQSAGCRDAFTAAALDRRESFKAFRQLGWRTYARLLYFRPKGGKRPWLITLSGKVEPLRNQVQHREKLPRWP